MSYRINRNGQQFGPYPLTDLQRYVDTGQILLTDLAHSDGMPQWLPVSQVLPRNPAPPPPPQGYGTTGYAAPAYGQPAGYYAKPPKTRVAYIMLGVFLGIFGVHNFYAGYTGKAVAQLLITVLSVFILSPVSGIWAIVEVCTVDRDSDNVPMI